MAKLRNPLGKSERKLKVVTLRLFEDDVEDAKDYFPTMGYNVVVRHAFASYMAEVRQKMTKEIASNDKLRNVRIEDSIDGSST